jgi:DNA-binding transcriptional ArsR family regulator
MAGRTTGTSDTAPRVERELIETLRALADPTRLEMVRMAAEAQEVACTTYLERFSVTKSTISYHVRILRAAGLMRVRKEGQFYYYRLDRRDERLLRPLLRLLRHPQPPRPPATATELTEVAGRDA